ncbi:DUF4202 domain-containing protein [Pedobacter sp. V48]|uniref:DUF4202 domain-containing protein n=1 Tax=Pedobacter sp. V48 TaxID=509635 RepID=UPI0003E587F0|nr:DUF4202 domain-containing protein [Pedobacter sp. V48]ETZ22786.1 hypothetical protein N824_21075 [Pedobacter sp. V48]
MSKLSIIFEVFDEYNRQDPRIFEWENTGYPQEYFFAIKLYDWVLQLDGLASEELLIASRCQHIGRWEIPRENYQEGREPYLKWRKDLAMHHATLSAGLMKQVGYTDDQIARVCQILLKKRIKGDADVQTMENALCLVFLQYQYDEFKNKYENDPEKMLNILRKSLLKMNTHGHRFALQLKYSPEGLALVQAAVDSL